MINNGSEEKISRVALYTRVSREEQAEEGYSLDSQLDHLRDYCRARDWTIAGEYVDPGFTGRNTNRPAYRKMLEEMDRWDALVIIKMDRIHRNQRNFTDMMVTLRKNNKEFVSMSESYDTSNAMGRFLMDFIQRLAQLESEILSERVIQGMNQKAKTPNSGWMGNKAAYGYLYDKKKKKLHDVPNELEIVKEIFRIYDEEQISMRELAKRVEIHHTQLVSIIRNPFYAGWKKWGNYLRRISLDPLITEGLFNKVQKKMRMKNTSHPHNVPFQIPESKGKDVIELDPRMLAQTSRGTRTRHNYTF